jgi:hypothetical protein
MIQEVGEQILVSFLSLNHDNSLARSNCSPTLTNPVFLTKWSVDHCRVFFVLYVRGYAWAQLVEALRCEPEGRGFDFRWGHWNFSFT